MTTEPTTEPTPATAPATTEPAPVTEPATPAAEQTTTQTNGLRNPEGQGALFKNDKGDNPKRPDYRGRCTIDGKERRISAWLKEDRGGKKYLSLAFQDNQTQESGDADPVLG